MNAFSINLHVYYYRDLMNLLERLENGEDNLVYLLNMGTDIANSDGHIDSRS